MIGCESSASASAALTKPQAAIRKSPLETAALCERLSSMELTSDQAAAAVERHRCPNCDAPAGSACRT